MKRIKWLKHDCPVLGKKITYRLDINAADFKGRAGMPWLIMAANTNLSINDLQSLMAAYGYIRTRSWISRRRWIFFDPEYVRNMGGGVSDKDGQQARAYQIMDANRNVSARMLVRILKDHGIKRGTDWVLKHRVR
jgi:hypothetical protein